jgi:hypothetical protein
MRLRLPDVVFRGSGSAARYASRPDALSGRVLGYLDGWGGGGHTMYPTMAALHAALVERHAVDAHHWVRKPDISRPVPEPTLQVLVRKTDLVINGEGL